MLPVRWTGESEMWIENQDFAAEPLHVQPVPPGDVRNRILLTVNVGFHRVTPVLWDMEAGTFRLVLGGQSCLAGTTADLE